MVRMKKIMAVLVEVRKCTVFGLPVFMTMPVDVEVPFVPCIGVFGVVMIMSVGHCMIMVVVVMPVGMIMMAMLMIVIMLVFAVAVVMIMGMDIFFMSVDMIRLLRLLLPSICNE